MWFNIAGAGMEIAEDGRDNREKIERKMTPADISEAQKRARHLHGIKLHGLRMKGGVTRSNS